MVPSIIASLFFRPVMDCSSTRWLRWALNCQLWKPVATQWNHANKCIQEEERQRIEQFVFQAPAISSLIGRLMLRKGIQEVIGSSNSNITFSRTAEGRPFLPGLDIIDINVSHHGDWVVLALESGARVGVDVMSMDRPINKDLREYFRLMRKQFTDNEWRQIDKSDNKLHAFYRFWCLKESYVKAIGVGLKYDLQTIDFNTSVNKD
ncbi:L-aminoadipate-semialdehyde dehydrogenase-phosphopantetheinyl transferase-like isoform X2 [Watersipora subatra]|uniref:L-aminoadipate-semialdehyde dehydrogenase-phosphopantetheinyl transferase-like isoform X2 n=1 Tax=Watersipora subatra TaxID=2589382 RepID=UPI00355B6DAA